MAKKENTDRRRLIGVIPAAGSASRLGNIPCSKEIMPLDVVSDSRSPAGTRIIVAIECTLNAFHEAGVEEVAVVISPDKEDVGVFLGSGDRWGLRLRFESITNSDSVPTTIDSVRHLLADADVAFGFPDIQFAPGDAIRRIADARHDLDADLMLALVPSTDGHKVDLVEIADTGRIIALLMKPGMGRSGWTWIAAVWSPAFTSFFHDELEKLLRRSDNCTEGTKEPAKEIFVGDIINRAVRAGLNVRGVAFEKGKALDIGTPESLKAAWSQK